MALEELSRSARQVMQGLLDIMSEDIRQTDQTDFSEQRATRTVTRAEV